MPFAHRSAEVAAVRIYFNVNSFKDQEEKKSPKRETNHYFCGNIGEGGALSQGGHIEARQEGKQVDQNVADDCPQRSARLQ